MEQNEKPYQSLAWLATGILIIAAALASFVPELSIIIGLLFLQILFGYMLVGYGKSNL